MQILIFVSCCRGARRLESWRLKSSDCQIVNLKEQLQAVLILERF